MSVEIQRHERPTIMSGRVLDFAMAFAEEEGIIGTSHRPVGPFHVSASRDAVMVHRCELVRDRDFEGFTEAIRQAKGAFEQMRGARW